MPKLRPHTNMIKRRQLHAFARGQESAVRSAVPQIERRYQLHTMVRFWVCMYAAFAVGVASGAALYATWCAAGL